MRLATVRRAGNTVAVRHDGDVAVEIDALDVGALLADPAWRERATRASGPTHPVDGLDFAPLVPHPEKIL